MTPIAIFSLWVFPLVVIWLFKKHPPPKATAYAFFLAMFFLPAGPTVIALPMFPAITKMNIAGLAVLIALTLKRPSWLGREKVGRGPELFALLSISGFLGTWLTNPEPLVYGRLAGQVENARFVFLPGQNWKDCAALIMDDLVTIVLPFVIGRAMFKTREDAKTLCYLFSCFGLIYVVLMLIEMRTSPQLHIWVWGYYPHPMFGQAARWGGWRPQVFTYHGLVLARLMVMVFLAIIVVRAAGIPKIWRFDTRLVSRMSPLFVIGGKSTGAIVYMLALWGVFNLGSRKLQLRMALALVGIVIGYFFLQTSGVLDLEAITNEIAKYSEERAGSLMYRFHHEAQLIERLEGKEWFGWGSYGRAHVWDVDSGTDLTVIDGYWIRRYAYFGIFGLFTPFYLLLLPALYWARRFDRVRDPSTQTMLNALVLMGVIYAVDCLPNAIQNNLCFMIAGASYGIVRNLTEGRTRR